MEKKMAYKIAAVLVIGLLSLMLLMPLCLAGGWGDNAVHNNTVDVEDDGSVYISIDMNNDDVDDQLFAIFKNGDYNTGTELFRVQEDGNVGIGALTPDRKLEIVDASNPQLRLSSVEDTSWTDLYHSDYFYIKPSHGMVCIQPDGSHSSQLEIEAGSGTDYDAVLTMDVGSNSWHIGVDDSITTDHDDPLNIGLGSDVNLYNYMTIEKYGEVGIGTETPSARLDIDPTVTSTSDYTGIRSDMTFNPGSGTMTNWYGAYIAAPTITTGTITNKYALVTESGAGKVGIGTPSPDNPLELLSSTTPQFRITNTDATDYATFSVDTDGQLDITTVDGGGTGGHINLKPDGHVGIGVDTPQELLHIHDSAVAIRLTNPTTGYGSGDGFEIGLSESASAAYINNRENSHIAIRTQSTTRILITGTGLVGIGDAITPNAILEVAQDDDNVDLVKFKATSTTQNSDIVWIGCPKLKASGSGYNLLKIDHDSSYSENALTVRGDGRTGIGTSTPIATLDVDGGFATQIYQPSSYPYTIDSGTIDDHTLICAVGTAEPTVTLDIDLPDANTCIGRILVIKKISGGNTLRIDAASGDSIEGAGTYTVATNKSYMIQSFDSNNWYIIADF